MGRVFNYLLWGGVLSGLLAYGEQARHGLAVTGLHDQALWGLYISQFVFLVGIAASAVLLVIPARLLGWPEARAALATGEALAVSAVFTALLFVTVDLGNPQRLWHALPVLGRLNFPRAVLAWDVVVLMAYLGLSLLLLWSGRRHAQEGRFRAFALLLAVGLGLAIHTVTAFLLAGHPARPFWHSGVMAPRFIASAFASGAALMLLLAPRLPALAAPPLTRYLRWVAGLGITLDLFLLLSELFVAFYGNSGEHRAARLIYGGEAGWLSAWVWSGLLLKGLGLALLRRGTALPLALLVAGTWLEKGLGLVAGGMLVTPLEEVSRYLPTGIEVRITLGVWAVGVLLFLALARWAGCTPRPRLSHAPD